MMTDDVFKLPDLGEGLIEADLVQWHVGPGDHVTADQPLVSVETDKAVVEIPAPHSGVIAELFAAEGDSVEVGAPLVRYEEGPPTDKGSIVGDTGEPQEVRQTPPAPKIAPAARTAARELDVDLSAVEPTGPGGVIVREDVERAARGAVSGEPITGARRAMARNMARAHREVVPASVTDEVDIETWTENEDPLIRLVQAIGHAAARAPALNAWFDPGTMTRQVHDHLDLGIAVNTDDGLFVPVLTGAGTRSSDELKVELDRLTDAVKTRTISPHELKGATLTVSNFGAIGGQFASMVVVPPQVAIVGAGRIRRKVVMTDGGPAAHNILPLSLTFDHRAVTGGEAAHFLNELIGDLQWHKDRRLLS